MHFNFHSSCNYMNISCILHYQKLVTLKRLNLVHSWCFFSLKISLFGCNVARCALSHADAASILFLSIFGHKVDLLVPRKRVASYMLQGHVALMLFNNYCSNLLILCTCCFPALLKTDNLYQYSPPSNFCGICAQKYCNRCRNK